MSSTPTASVDPAKPGTATGTAKKIVAGCILVPLVAFLSLGLVTLQAEQKTEEQRRAIARVGGKSETERHAPEWTQKLAGPDFHSFLDRTQLVLVRMEGEKIGDAELILVSSLPDIHTLILENSNVTNEGLKTVAQMKTLRNLNLIRTKVTDPTPLSALQNLEELRLSHSDVNEAALEVVSQLPKLRTLGIAGLEVGDRGIAIVAKCTNLEVLNIEGAILGDTGLQPLHAMKSMKFISLKDSRRNPADLAELKKALPGCKFIE